MTLQTQALGHYGNHGELFNSCLHTDGNHHFLLCSLVFISIISLVLTLCSIFYIFVTQLTCIMGRFVSRFLKKIQSTFFGTLFSIKSFIARCTYK